MRVGWQSGMREGARTLCLWVGGRMRKYDSGWAWKGAVDWEAGREADAQPMMFFLVWIFIDDKKKGMQLCAVDDINIVV